jgi:cell division protein FtsB
MSRYAARYESGPGLARRVSGPLLCVLALFYLGFHTISGERGLLALFEEKQKHTQLTQRLETVQQQREMLEKKTSLLSDASLDLDMLDEQARRMLGMVGKNEVVIFLDASH